MKVNYRLFGFFIVIILSIAFSIPSLTNMKNAPKITLGLDLQGGLHLLLGVDTHNTVYSKFKLIALNLRHFTNVNDILIEDFKIKDGFISFKLLDEDDDKSINDFLSKQKGLSLKKLDGVYKVSMSLEYKDLLIQQSINQAVEVIRNRLDQFGLAEPLVAKQGDDKILVQVPGIKTVEEEQRLRALIGKAAYLQLNLVDEDRQDRVYTMTKQEVSTYSDIILEDYKNSKIKYLLKEIPILDGSKLTDASVGFDDMNRPVINFVLDSQGADIFADFTGKNIGKRLAVILDKKVYSAPVIRERIGGGSGQISGNFTVKEAKDLAIALRSGSLLSPVYVLEKRSVGPSLGKDSIKASLISLSIGFCLVVLFMVFYYGISGLISNVALITNLFIIISVMALLGATLTLPGAAGIVLTVGMAVDANVIINERIRELLEEGSSVKKSIENGYLNATNAIIDANITTLIAAIVLYAYGSGPIKGFAITISIGILASMLTAIYGTKAIYYSIIDKIKKEKIHKWFGVRKVLK